ncbi:MAG: hypothetical protein LUF27_04085 [Lachnospiraceae bacterium]|nr:hypothetical protein [Lachnospiraceae bacterium]
MSYHEPIPVAFPLFYQCVVAEGTPLLQYDAVNILLRGASMNEVEKDGILIDPPPIDSPKCTLYISGGRKITQTLINAIFKCSHDEIVRRLKQLRLVKIDVSIRRLIAVVNDYNPFSSTENESLKQCGPSLENQYDYLADFFICALKNTKRDTRKLSKDEITALMGCNILGSTLPFFEQESPDSDSTDAKDSASQAPHQDNPEKIDAGEFCQVDDFESEEDESVDEEAPLPTSFSDLPTMRSWGILQCFPVRSRVSYEAGIIDLGRFYDGVRTHLWGWFANYPGREEFTLFVPDEVDYFINLYRNGQKESGHMDCYQIEGSVNDVYSIANSQVSKFYPEIVILADVPKPVDNSNASNIDKEELADLFSAVLPTFDENTLYVKVDETLKYGCTRVIILGYHQSDEELRRLSKSHYSEHKPE